MYLYTKSPALDCERRRIFGCYLVPPEIRLRLQAAPSRDDVRSNTLGGVACERRRILPRTSKMNHLKNIFCALPSLL